MSDNKAKYSVKLIDHGFNFNTGKRHLLEVFGLDRGDQEVGCLELDLSIDNNTADLVYSDIILIADNKDSIIVDAELVFINPH